MILNPTFKYIIRIKKYGIWKYVFGSPRNTELSRYREDADVYSSGEIEHIVYTCLHSLKDCEVRSLVMI